MEIIKKWFSRKLAVLIGIVVTVVIIVVHGVDAALEAAEKGEALAQAIISGLGIVGLVLSGNKYLAVQGEVDKEKEKNGSAQ